MSKDDIEAIRQLKSRYFRYIDTKQWSVWRSLFTEDCRFEGTSRPYTGPDEFCASTAAWLDRAVTVHQGFMPEIRLDGRDAATGIWAMHDIVQFEEPIAAGAYQGMKGFEGYGHYDEEYRRLDGEWRISRLRLTRLRVDPIADGRPLHPLPEGLIKSGAGDR